MTVTRWKSSSHHTAQKRHQTAASTFQCPPTRFKLSAPTPSQATLFLKQKQTDAMLNRRIKTNLVDLGTGINGVIHPVGAQADVFCQTYTGVFVVDADDYRPRLDDTSSLDRMRWQSGTRWRQHERIFNKKASDAGTGELTPWFRYGRSCVVCLA